ncbi:MAG: oxidoreductase [gamma proteobacterium symbiont of Bathyaustriella thionipta]|nr:oxidoreductase [gamma proteobacterium symbiont of Bathyaustriella thionipta]MCU7948843.1 oxidoreductase [gamma proteobacterium symbiont of Bathyaustriella thionipta]MCU7954346.1 oxidoreductase [gamma proteobacterium symbiont of Bathyaustriella thionipta]MCU7955301.1 oxidoreductase [gamma proteobacterium symbiont of Bathyaustriella thionipta]MCU7967130.1 oxidoreductase [gamma proteobacterium symbiont of Bathyaustriella thionipta]
MLSFLLPQRVKLLGLLIAAGVVAAVAALGWQVAELGAQRYAIGGWGAPLGIDLYADGLSLLMLMVNAVVCLGVSVYSTGYFNRAYFRRSRAIYFWPLWMFLWAALNALFLSSDIFNLYVTLELLGLSAVALVALAGGADALTSAMRYLLINLLGSLFYLLGVALLYHRFGSLDITILSQHIEPSPAVWVAMGLMTSGLLLKTALFPMHFWLPAAHASAPAPVSALLSALVVKASFYIFLRLWLEIFPVDSSVFGELLGVLGAIAIFWGGVQALRQTRLKMLIAYSTVAQLGYLFLAFPMASYFAWKGALFILLSHALAKTAMFMAAGNILHFGGHDRIQDFDHVVQYQPLTSAAFALAGISIMGLPPSGGFIGKWLLLEAAINSGQWWLVIIIIMGGLLAAAYIFKVIGYAFTQSRKSHQTRRVPIRMEWTALILAIAAILLGLIAPWPLAIMDIGLPFSGEAAG